MRFGINGKIDAYRNLGKKMCERKSKKKRKKLREK